MERFGQSLHIEQHRIKKIRLTIGIVFVELQSTLIPN